MARRKSAASKPATPTTPISGMIVGDYSVSVAPNDDILLENRDGSRKIFELPVAQAVQIRDALTHILKQFGK